MKFLLDTSVLVPALFDEHVHHGPSIRLLSRANKETSFITTHALAECFAVLTRLPGYARTADEVLLCIQQFQECFAILPLKEPAYLTAMERVAAARMSGGAVFDALHLGAALAAKLQVVYTWNVKHFERLATGFSIAIRTPAHAD